MKALLTAWYRANSWTKVLQPVAWLFGKLAAVRRRRQQQSATHMPVPVIVVGNITVGGTGKTPLVLYLLDQLQQRGLRPGVVSRGYGGKAAHYPILLGSDSRARQVGDEPVLIALQSHCPVVVDPNRVRACQYLLANTDCNIIISDDGLQHYGLARDIEIAVIDGQRRLGNGRLLPAGPLREPAKRLTEVDFVVANGAIAQANEWPMQLQSVQWVNVKDSNITLRLAEFAGLDAHAVAGIGNPSRFFNTLQELGVQITVHAFPDHHPYSEKDFSFTDTRPVLMTQKDAVKCMHFAKANWWYLQVQAVLPPTFMIKLCKQLAEREQHG